MFYARHKLADFTFGVRAWLRVAAFEVGWSVSGSIQMTERYMEAIDCGKECGESRTGRKLAAT